MNRQHQRLQTITKLARCPVTASIGDIVAETGLSRRTVERYLADAQARHQIDELREKGPDLAPPTTDDELLAECIRGLWSLAHDLTAAPGVRERAWRGVADIAHRRIDRAEDEELERVNEELRRRGLLR